MPIFKTIHKVILTLNADTITSERKETLEPFIKYIKNKAAENKEIRINFICTHNSRRSHLAQVWAQTMAYYFNIKNVFCYSGGTEVTALFPKIANTLVNSGFQIKTISEGNNPVYSIKYAENEHPVIGFSKKLDDDFNPTANFIAIMTCNSAYEACPYVSGAEKCFSFTFDDPKIFDNTPQQTEKYKERSLQIATEMHYIFSQIN